MSSKTAVLRFALADGEAPSTSKPPVGTRQRRHLSTRRSLREAAIRLFTDHGYAATTVAQIADAADVSERSFYRYFPSKEAIALEELRGFIDLGLALVRERPESEHPIDSILASIDALESTDFDASLGLDFRLTLENNSVAGLQRAMSLHSQDALTELFATRLGVHVNDLGPRVLAATATLAFESAVITWMRRTASGEAGPSVWELARRAVESCADGLRRMPSSGLGAGPTPR